MTLKNIVNGALKTLGWLAAPELMAAKELDPGMEDEDYSIGAALATMTTATMLLTWGINAGYSKLTETEYNNKNKDITINIDNNAAVNKNFGYYASYTSPLARLILIGTADDVTTIKTGGLEIQIEGENALTFDKTRGFSINKESFYNNNFKLSSGQRLVEDKDSLEKLEQYSPKEINKIFEEYKSLKQNSTQLKEKALNNGDINKAAELENKIIKLKDDYEFGRARLKNAQIRMEKETNAIIDQLNTEYFSYKNAPADTAIPVRDYDLSNIKK